MARVSEILALVYFDLLEDSGPILGIFTDQQLIELLSLAAIDFMQRTCLYQSIFTQPVAAGASQYQYPDTMQRADLVFLAGALLEPATVAGLNSTNKNWRTELGLPIRWHQDQLPAQTIELAKIPNYSSLVFDPQSTFSPVIGGQAVSPDQAGALSIIGPTAAVPVTALDSVLEGIDDDWALTAISFGLLARLFSSDSELRDNARAAWCEQQFNELCAIGQSIAGEMASK